MKNIKIVALTGVTGAMGGEALLSLMQSPDNLNVLFSTKRGKYLRSLKRL